LFGFMGKFKKIICCHKNIQDNLIVLLQNEMS